jgi:hypothetical protein
MSKTLQRRLAHLEGRAGINVDPWPVIIRYFINPDDPKPWKPTSAAAYGRVWRREPGEAVEDFEKRVIADAQSHLRLRQRG